MPVYKIVCPDCGYEYLTLVMEGARVPRVWVCSQCKGRNGRVAEDTVETAHPWSGPAMESCCG
ncbi:MAG: hypothetical protein F4Y75_08095 [Acidimicrobiia bacterium]|nr:hypothetical protein [Acidimicrobiia bacterium]MXZ07442.1 hypothetical protein [Acidimicrobiia bacterium]MYD04326.1 hypothetical protein [Acidimicrobiia bacterium]MYH55307.1 hypothetical protein [Acidimicrobiia bacterium]